MQQGGAFPDSFVAVLCLHNANLSDHEKALVVAITHSDLAITEIAQQMRRPSGPMGASAREDVLVAGNVDPAESSLAEMQGRESRLDCRKAKKKLRRAPGQAEGKSKSINPETGKRNRRFLRNSAHRLLPTLVAQRAHLHPRLWVLLTGDLPTTKLRRGEVGHSVRRLDHILARGLTTGHKTSTPADNRVPRQNQSTGGACPPLEQIPSDDRENALRRPPMHSTPFQPPPQTLRYPTPR